jgi:hypothetical protein
MQGIFYSTGQHAWNSCGIYDAKLLKDKKWQWYDIHRVIYNFNHFLGTDVRINSLTYIHLHPFTHFSKLAKNRKAQQGKGWLHCVKSVVLYFTTIICHWTEHGVFCRNGNLILIYHHLMGLSYIKHFLWNDLYFWITNFKLSLIKAQTISPLPSKILYKNTWLAIKRQDLATSPSNEIHYNKSV